MRIDKYWPGRVFCTPGSCVPDHEWQPGFHSGLSGPAFLASASCSSPCEQHQKDKAHSTIKLETASKNRMKYVSDLRCLRKILISSVSLPKAVHASLFPHSFHCILLFHLVNDEASVSCFSSMYRTDRVMQAANTIPVPLKAKQMAKRCRGTHAIDRHLGDELSFRRSVLRWKRDGARQTARLVGVIWFSATLAVTSLRRHRSVRIASRFSSGRSSTAARTACRRSSLGMSGEQGGDDRTHI